MRQETSRLRVFAGTLLGTALCVVAAVLADSFNFAEMSQDHFRRALATDILLPTLIGGPFFYFLLEKIRQLAVAKVELQRLASTDSLTAVLSRGAFEMLVEAYLERARAGSLPQTGSFLIVDADHFKAINDGHGHQAGDQALKLIAGAIKETLSPADLVGRVGGEEFAVFLPAVVDDTASRTAELIRQRIRALPFPRDVGEGLLSVSIGGATFRENTSYEELFKTADRRLYEAKASGRNLVRMSI
ncbi:hypothetical protein ASF70_08150 [Rhizobium sp. Leaf321]|nr:hypothetical protein ASF70_08150 [Rhizobium sp. Leaf321]